MHPARLNMLSKRHEVFRKVTKVEWSPSENLISLNCGHELHFNAHMCCDKLTEVGCQKCGEEVVKKLYASEFIQA